MRLKICIGIVGCLVALNSPLVFSMENAGNGYKQPAIMQKIMKTTALKGPVLNKLTAQGVAAPFCGVLNNTLIFAGGSNWSNNTLGDGKSAGKIYHKDIYGAILKDNSKKLSWKKLGELPEELAGGAVVVSKESMFIIGGSNAKGDKAAVLELSFTNGAIKCEAVSWLPVLISNHGAAIMDDYIYVAGGLQNNKPSRDVYRMNLKGNRKLWEKLTPLPEDARIQPIVCSQKDASGKDMLYVWSGFTGWGKDAGLICGGYKYNPITKKWTGLGAPLKNEKRVYLGGGNAVALGDNQIIAFGGFEYSVFLESLRKAQPDYVKHEASWYKHNQEIYSFDTINNRWSCIGNSPTLATVHAGSASWGKKLYNLEGELKPGTATNVITIIDM